MDSSVNSQMPLETVSQATKTRHAKLHHRIMKKEKPKPQT